MPSSVRARKKSFPSSISINFILLLGLLLISWLTEAQISLFLLSFKYFLLSMINKISRNSRIKKYEMIVSYIYMNMKKVYYKDSERVLKDINIFGRIKIRYLRRKKRRSGKCVKLCNLS